MENLTGIDNEDGTKTYTITLSDGLVWSDGSPMTAKDYVFAILLESSPEMAEIDGYPVNGYTYLVGYDAFSAGESKVHNGVTGQEDECVIDITGGAEQLLMAVGAVTMGRSERKVSVQKFELRSGMVLDCGEDKDDSHAEYGGVNAFATFRRKESEFFQSLESSDKPTFAIGHMCPAQITDRPGSEFDIENEVFAQWVAELERIGISFMLSGHFHRTYVLKSNDDRSLIPHNFPVIIGTGCDFAKDDMWGTAITIEGGKANIKFTDSHHNVRESHVIDIK